MSADDDLDELEAQLEDYDDDDDDAPAIKLLWKKYKLVIIPAAAFVVFIPVILLSVGGSDDNAPRLMVIPELAPQPGKQIKMSPDSPGGQPVPGQEKGVYNVVTDGKNEGKVVISAPPEEPKKPAADGKTPKGGETPIAMIPEGAEKTPKDGDAVEGALMPPPTPPETAGEVVIPALPDPTAPVPADGKIVENILPAPTAPAADGAQPDKPVDMAAKPAQPTATLKAPADDNQITVMIPKATDNGEQVAVLIPRTPAKPVVAAPGGGGATPMRTMAGVYRVQVASARSESAAKTLWEKNVSKHPDVLGKLPLTVQTALIKDRGTFYRVQVGAFNDRESADSVCHKLKSRGQDCIVVRP